jgi:WhiB family transcriptional regulator, redox-sensing transcriptional regulator
MGQLDLLEADLGGLVDIGLIDRETDYAQPQPKPSDQTVRAVGGGSIVGFNSDPETDKRWQAYSNCMGVDPDLFVPTRGDACRGCTVRQDCIEFSAANGEKFGLWNGGISIQEKRQARRFRLLMVLPSDT